MRPIAATISRYVSETNSWEKRRVTIVKIFPEDVRKYSLAMYITKEGQLATDYIDAFSNCSLMEETYEVEGSILPYQFVPSRSEDKI